MEDIIDIIVTETTNLIEITSQPTDEVIDVNIIDNREDIVLNVTPNVVEININSLTGNFGVNWGDITGTLSNQTDLQTVLNAKADLVGGLVPSSQLPSFVDDVIEVATFAALPVTGEQGKIYITLDTNFIYRWSGSAYIEIKDSSAVWGAITGTLSSQNDLQTALNLKLDVTTAASTYVDKTNNQSIGGVKTFTSMPILSAASGVAGQIVFADASNQLKTVTNFKYNDSTGVLTTQLGALGTNAYNSIAYLPLAGGTMSGAIVGTTATFTNSGSGIGLGLTQSGATGDGIKITHSAGRAFNILSSGSGFGIIINNETASTSTPFTIQKQGASVITLTDTGAGTFNSSLTASSFIKSGGTSAQFLKANGSVDSTSYQPLLTNPITGTGTSGILPKFTGANTIGDSQIYDNGTRVSIGADVTTSSRFVSVSSTSSAYAIIAQASSGANGIFSVALGTGEIFRGQNGAGAYFIVDNTANTFISGKLNVGDFSTSSYKLNVVGTGNFTGALSGTSATFSGDGSFGSGTADVTITIPTNNTGSGYAGRILGKNSTGQLIIQHRDNSATFVNAITISSGGGTPVVSLGGTLNVTGAATFSSSVTATDNIFINGSGNTNLFFQQGGTNKWIAGYVTSLSAFRFSNGASDVVTFTNAGNVGIGTTAPGAPLEVRTGTGANLRVRENGSNNLLLQNFNSTDNYRNLQIASSTIQFFTGTEGGDSTTERARFTADGVLQFSTISTVPTYNNSIYSYSTNGYMYIQGGSTGVALAGSGNRNNAIYVNSTNNEQYFYTNGTEKMRITSGGNILMGTSSDGGYPLLVGKQRDGGWQAAFVNTATGGTSQVFLSHGEGYGAYVDSGALGNTSARYIFKAVSGGSERFVVRGDGAIYAPGVYSFTTGSVSNVVVFSDGSMQRSTVSSARFKDNITDWDASGLNTILALKPKEFTYKKDYYQYSNKKFLGLIAEEVAQVSPYLADYQNEDGSGLVENVRYANIVVPLIKAVQELKAELDTLKNK